MNSREQGRRRLLVDPDLLQVDTDGLLGTQTESNVRTRPKVPTAPVCVAEARLETLYQDKLFKNWT